MYVFHCFHRKKALFLFLDGIIRAQYTYGFSETKQVITKELHVETQYYTRIYNENEVEIEEE